MDQGPSWSWSYGSWIYNQMCNQCLYITTNVVSSNPVNDDIVCYIQPVCDKVGQWLATGWWFSLGTPVSSTNKNWPPRYQWNIFESGVKHHKPCNGPIIIFLWMKGMDFFPHQTVMKTFILPYYEQLQIPRHAYIKN